MRRVTPVVLLALALAACSSGDSNDGSSYELAEFYISGPGQLDAGTQIIAGVNSGDFPHTIVVTSNNGTVIGATEPINPGEETTLELELEEGTYQFTCRIVAQVDDGSLVDHYEQGMAQTVRVGA